MTAVGFEPTQLALVELESTPLDHSGKLSCFSPKTLHIYEDFKWRRCKARWQYPSGTRFLMRCQTVAHAEQQDVKPGLGLATGSQKPLGPEMQRSTRVS